MIPKFWHAPRTGGNSIRESWRPTRHELVGHRRPPEVKPDGEFWYSATRNPWDRVVSLWCLSHPGEWSRGEEPFRAWVLGGMVNHIPRDEAREKWQRICAPTICWNRDADFVIRFERYAEDVARLAAILDRPTPTAHAGKSRRGPYPDYYDAETIAYVAERYREDVEAFGYSFEGARCAA